MPEAHLEAGLAQAAQIQPLNAEGNPDPNGWIVFLGVGFSNTNQEFSHFESMVDAAGSHNGRVILITTAQGGQTASVLANPNAQFWDTSDDRLSAMGVTHQQVQACWLKQAAAYPEDDFPNHVLELREDVEDVVHILKDRHPNLRICYLSSRIYAGYSVGDLSPEPQAYEEGFAFKWLIEDQINGDGALAFEGTQAAAPWLAWGPYLWADGVIPRQSDGLTWLSTDFERDGAHPSSSCEEKVAQMLSDFMMGEPTAQSWYPPQSGTTLVALAAIDDASADSGDPAENTGAAELLSLGSSETPSIFYVKFDISSVVLPILFAKLSLRAGPDGSNALDPSEVSLVSDSTWQESTLTYLAAPEADSTITQLAAYSRGSVIDVNVTDIVLDDTDGFVTFALETRGQVGGAIYSSESDFPPRLILTLDAN